MFAVHQTVFRARDLQADKSPREPIKRNTGTPDRRPKSASSKLVSKASGLSVKGVQAKVSGQVHLHVFCSGRRFVS